jgi:hypothetical protein
MRAVDFHGANAGFFAGIDVRHAVRQIQGAVIRPARQGTLWLPAQKLDGIFGVSSQDPKHGFPHARHPATHPRPQA